MSVQPTSARLTSLQDPGSAPWAPNDATRANAAAAPATPRVQFLSLILLASLNFPVASSALRPLVPALSFPTPLREHGRGSTRETLGQFVSILGVTFTFNKKMINE